MPYGGIIDAGADRSTVPPPVSDRRRHSSDNAAWAADNTPIRTYGEHRAKLDLGFGRTFAWVFLVADVRQCIIRTDFLKHFDLIPDVKRQ